MVQETVEHIRCFTLRGLNGLGVERGKPITDKAIEYGARISAMPGIIVSRRLSAAASGKALPISRRGSTITPAGGERFSMLGIDNGRDCFGVCFGSDMALNRQHHLMDGYSARTLSHSLHAKIGGIGEDRGHQRRHVGGTFSGPEVCETIEKTCPAM